MSNEQCSISGTAFSGIGGQAVMEGVMMRNKDDYAVAVRKTDGSVVVKKGEYKGVIANETIYKVPIIRGVLSFIDSLVLGLSTLNYSSDIYIQSAEVTEHKGDSEDNPDSEIEGEDDKNASSGDGKSGEKKAGDSIVSALVMVAAIAIALVLFMVLPYLASLLFKPLVGEGIVLSLIEGVIRILIFIGYIKAISLMEDIRRVFMYHGAEHKCINCIEAGMPLDVEHVRMASREHRRCGTSFLLYVMVISIIFFAFIQTDVRWLKVVMRIVLIPVIAGVSYEFIRLAGRSESGLVRVLSKPGLWLQRLTTREPDDQMIEVGIRSVEEVFDWREFITENFDGNTEGE